MLRRFARDERGVSAVEFALIAPIMILFYFGLAEFCQAFMAQKRMGHVSATVADLVTQDQTTSAEELEQIFLVGPLIMRPFPTADLHQRVTSVVRDGAGRMVVDWSYGSGMDALEDDEVLTDVPDDLLEEEGQSLIMTEVTYEYDSPSDYVIKDLPPFSHKYYLRPRTVEQIIFED